MALAEWIMVVEGEVDAGVLHDWNRWYDEVHLPEITDCPGFVRSFRYVGHGDDAPRFLTIYELEGVEALETEEFGRRRGVGPFAGRAQARTRLYHRHLAWDPGAR